MARPELLAKGVVFGCAPRPATVGKGSKLPMAPGEEKMVATARRKYSQALDSGRWQPDFLLVDGVNHIRAWFTDSPRPSPEAQGVPPNRVVGWRSADTRPWYPASGESAIIRPAVRL